MMASRVKEEAAEGPPSPASSPPLLAVAPTLDPKTTKGSLFVSKRNFVKGTDYTTFIFLRHSCQIGLSGIAVEAHDRETDVRFPPPEDEDTFYTGHTDNAGSRLSLVVAHLSLIHI